MSDREVSHACASGNHSWCYACASRLHCDCECHEAEKVRAQARSRQRVEEEKLARERAEKGDVDDVDDR